MNPTVSVVIPAYNHAAYLPDTLESVFAQTFTDYEVVVVNDGSPDETATVLQPWVASGRVLYVEQANAGQGAARNRGLAAARGEFVAFLDDDDVWPAGNLQVQVRALRDDPAAVLAYGDVRTFPAEKTFDRHLHRSGRSARCELFLGNMIVTPGQTVVRRTALEAVGGFDPAIWGCDDWDLYLRLADVGPFAYTGQVAVHYRMHAHNASRNRLRMFENAMRVFAKNGPVGAEQRRCWREGRRALRRLGGRFAVDECCEAIRDGRTAAGFVGLLRVWRHSPGVAFRRSVLRQVLAAVRHAGGSGRAGE